MYPDQQNAQMAAEKTYYDSRLHGTPAPQPVNECAQTPRATDEPFTLRGEARKSALHHLAEAQRANARADFFAAHPEFDEFIRLIRSGAIHV